MTKVWTILKVVVDRFGEGGIFLTLWAFTSMNRKSLSIIY